MSEEKPEVKLIKQSYREARDSCDPRLPNLNLIGLVSFFGTDLALVDINNGLRKEAGNLDCTHIFGVTYRLNAYSSMNKPCTLAYGDAYRPKKTNKLLKLLFFN